MAGAFPPLENIGGGTDVFTKKGADVFTGLKICTDVYLCTDVFYGIDGRPCSQIIDSFPPSSMVD